MADNLYSTFLLATKNVFELMLDLADITDKPVDDINTEGMYDISIGVTGDLQGEVIYCFPYDTSINIVKIMSGMEIDTVDDFVVSAVSEIANIISGNVLTMLSEENIKCDILPPMPYDRKKDSECKEYSIHTASRIKTAAGHIYLEVKLNPAK